MISEGIKDQRGMIEIRKKSHYLSSTTTYLTTSDHFMTESKRARENVDDEEVGKQATKRMRQEESAVSLK
jgi:hypothetical protein